VSHTILLVDADGPTTVLRPTQPPAGHHRTAEGPALARDVLAPACLIRHTLGMTIGELLRSTRERHGLTQARLARRIGSDRAYISRVEAGEMSPTIDWVRRAMAAMGEELVLDVQRSRFDDHDPQAHRLVGSWDPDRRLEDFRASASALDTLTRTKP
jgi:transcriptional regulator with XRE-family HTH domain